MGTNTDDPEEATSRQKAALEHVRAVWLYHSDQRVKNFNIYVIFIGALFAGFTRESDEVTKLIIVGMTFVLTVAFAIINKRNEDIIHDCHEELERFEPKFSVRLIELDGQRCVRRAIISHGFAYKLIFWIVGVVSLAAGFWTLF